MARILRWSCAVPLPRTVKLFPGETTTSYLARLAHANRLDAEALLLRHPPATGAVPRWFRPAWSAIMTGFPAGARCDTPSPTSAPATVLPTTAPGRASATKTTGSPAAYVSWPAASPCRCAAGNARRT